MIDLVLGWMLAHAPLLPPGVDAAKALRPVATAIAFAVDETTDELGNARYLLALACPLGRPCDPGSRFGVPPAFRPGAPRMWLARVALRRAGRR